MWRLSPADDALTVGLFGEDVLGDVGGLADSDGVDGPHSQDVLLLGDHALLHAVLQLLHRAGVDPHPLLRPGRAHLDMVARDLAAAIPLGRLPGDGKEVAAGSGHVQLNGRRWDAWRGTGRTELDSFSMAVI